MNSEKIMDSGDNDDRDTPENCDLTAVSVISW